jgi:hypothetical protein
MFIITAQTMKAKEDMGQTYCGIEGRGFLRIVGKKLMKQAAVFRLSRPLLP